MMLSGFTRKISFLKSLISKEIAYYGPFHVTVDVTRRCNLNCIGCRYHSQVINRSQSPGNQDDLDLDINPFKKLCQELSEMGTRAIELTGEGEPLLNENIFPFITIAKEHGLTVTVLTNGTILDSSRIESLIHSRLDRLKVSLWACTKKTYEDNYPGTNPDFFEKIIDGLNRLASAKKTWGSKKPALIVHHPINRNNFRTLDTLVDLIRETGCDGVTLSPLKIRRGELASVALSPDEEKEVCSALVTMKKRLDSLGLSHNVDETLLRYKVGESVWQKLPCYIGFITSRVKVDGTVLPCNPCNIPMGNINDVSFVEIWNNEAYKNFRRKALTGQGLASMNGDCDCGYCCFLNDNWRTHRLYKWIAPFMT